MHTLLYSALYLALYYIIGAHLRDALNNVCGVDPDDPELRNNKPLRVLLDVFLALTSPIFILFKAIVCRRTILENILRLFYKQPATAFNEDISDEELDNLNGDGGDPSRN